MSSNSEAVMTSTSESPSRSVATTACAPFAVVVIKRSWNDWSPSFSYHATVSSVYEAESASTSPSPSTSAA